MCGFFTLFGFCNSPFYNDRLLFSLTNVHANCYDEECLLVATIPISVRGVGVSDPDRLWFEKARRNERKGSYSMVYVDCLVGWRVGVGCSSPLETAVRSEFKVEKLCREVLTVRLCGFLADVGLAALCVSPLATGTTSFIDLRRVKKTQARTNNKNTAPPTTPPTTGAIGTL